MRVIKTFAAQRRWHPNEGSPGMNGHYEGSEVVITRTDQIVNEYLESVKDCNPIVAVTASSIDSVLYFVTVATEKG